MNTTWKLAARLAWSRPWMFLISFLMWVLFMGSPLATGLITREFFNTLTGAAPAGIGVAALLGLLVGLLIGHALDSRWFAGPKEDPYRVLGLTEEATDAEVDLAYRRLIAQYHPDRLAGAAHELQRQAESRAREINGAYDRIQAQRKGGRRP